MFPDVDARTAVKKAKEAAREYAEAELDVRVEEVVQHSPFSWDITLSWLVDNKAKLIEDERDPLKFVRVAKASPSVERVYRKFLVRGDDPVDMKRAFDS